MPSAPTTPKAPGDSGNPADKTKDFLQKPPAVAVPKGGGAIQGIGEKFTANPVTGTASFSVPIALSPGRGGFGPSIGLGYDSGAGNSPFGLGWRADVPSIKRKTDKGLPLYRDSIDSDTYVFSEAEDLVPLLKYVSSTWVPDTFTSGAYTVRRYRPRVEGAFARIERWTHSTTGVAHWQTVARDNTRRFYGESSAARLADPDNAAHVFEWLLERTEDELGNVIAYEYKAEDGVNVDPSDPADSGRTCAYAYLKRVKYGNATPFTASSYKFEVVLDYGEHTANPPTPTENTTWPVRQDPHSSFRSGFDERCRRLCKRVLMFHRISTLSTDPVLVKSTEFEHAADPKFTKLLSVTWKGWDTTGASVVTATLPPVAFTYSEPVIDETIRFVEGMDDLPGGLDAGRFQWVDLDGEGLTGLLSEQAGAWFYKRCLGEGKLAPIQRLGLRPNFDLRAPGSRLMDVEGDGNLDLVRLGGSPPSGFMARVDGGWEAFRPFKTVPNLNFNDPNLRMIDLDGDGHADILITEDDVLTWYPSHARDGFGRSARVWKPAREEDGPRVVFASGDESIYLADMSGDGLVDIVRIRNNSVCYWPNRGYGKFGKRVVMKGAPFFDSPDMFDPKRVRLADVDGSGTTDILYLGPSCPRLWFNRSGNSWSSEVKLQRFPSVASHATIEVADLEGNGTACLVWSSPLLGDLHRPLRYVRLMGQGKPHVLTKIVNNLGRETRLTYTPSTKFYVDDRKAGKPWATRLPFPVHCLSKTETLDHITGWRFAQTYAYHHGYFDGDEREFRGFGKVETWDTESVSDFEDPAHSNTGMEHHVPPVRTATWFHTGAWRRDQTLLDAFEAEYWKGDSVANALDFPKASLPSGLTVEEQKQAARALKGKVLRTEVYSEDGSGVAANPYSVADSRYDVKLVQPQGAQKHAAFLVVPRESLTYQYERNTDDPRVAHALTLAVDDYGNVTRSAAVSYPRRDDAGNLAEQEVLTVVVSETCFINQVDSNSVFHLGVPWETKSWHLTGMTYTEGTATVADVNDDLTSATAVDFEDAPGTGLKRRLLGHERTAFWNDGLTAATTAGSLGARALVREKYKLVYTSGLVTDVHGTEVTSTILSDEGGYVNLLSDGHYWVRSGIATLDASHFYHPTAMTDVWGNVTTLTWDSHDLFVTAVEAPLVAGATATDGLTTTADVNYRVLQPFRTTDPNGTKNEAAFDPLGRVVKTAVVGRESEGDVLATSPGTEITYETSRWIDDQLPNRVHVKVREAHGGSTFLETWLYSDGGGKEVMTKIEAAPGAVPGETGTINPRYIGTGRTVVDNKGNVVKQFEPYFSANNTYEFEDDIVATGVTPVMSYDPLGRLIRTDFPDETYSKVEFTAWKQDTWDQNDTVTDTVWYDDRMALSSGNPERRAAELAAAHADTPTTAHLDALGRPFRTDEVLETTTPTIFTTVVTLDVQGNPRVLTDARDIATQSQVFDMLGRPMKTVSPDAGETRAFIDAAGQAGRTWKPGGLSLRQECDEMRRPTKLWVTEASVERLAQLTVYGEVLATATAEAGYLLGRVYRVYDTAGCVTSTANDFKGNPLSVNRRVLVELDTEVDWSAADAYTSPADIDTAVGALLESETWTSTGTFDALNRPVTSTSPDDSERDFTYDVGGKLTAVDVKVRGATTATDVVNSITYNSKGQRLAIAYGNGTTTTNTYDAATFRLATLVTSDGTDDLQDLAYVYDPVGNIVQVTDASQQTYYFNNTVISPTQKYEYDALYRLTQAEGRESGTLTQTGYGDPSYGDVPHGNDSTTIRSYTQSYEYDEVGNITQVAHFCGTGSPGNWTRYYSYASTSNRLLRTSIPSDNPATPGSYSHVYTHTARGAMDSMPHLATITLDFRDQMRTADLGSGDDAVYHYDAGGQRVRKIVRRGANTEETLYLGGFEVYRKKVSGVQKNERETVHVMDDQRRVLMIETATKDNDGSAIGTPVPRFRYQLDNHLGTACVEVDETGALISYEEYHPFGSTSWHARDSSLGVSAKRYRYCGKEKDDETGLIYIGARYYAGWLGRWTSADPSGGHRYAYCSNRPIVMHDPDGREEVPAPTASTDWTKHAVGTPEQKAAAAARVEDLSARVRVAPPVAEDPFVLGGASGFAAWAGGTASTIVGGLGYDLESKAIDWGTAKASGALYAEAEKHDFLGQAQEGWGAGFGAGVIADLALMPGPSELGVGDDLLKGLYGAAKSKLGSVVGDIVGAGGTELKFTTGTGLGRARSMEEAVEFARSLGVNIPENLQFKVVPDSYFSDPNIKAQYLDLRGQTGREMYDLMDLTVDGDWMVKVRASVLESDEAIAWVLSHEASEIKGLEASLENGAMNSDLLRSTIGMWHAEAIKQGNRYLEIVQRMAE